MPTVSVDATWRMTRFEINAPHTTAAAVYGYSEVLLQVPSSKDGEKVTYGAMPGKLISRVVNDVLEETVDVNGKPVSFTMVLESLEAFCNKWKVEDESKPPPEPAANMDVNPPPELLRNI